MVRDERVQSRRFNFEIARDAAATIAAAAGGDNFSNIFFLRMVSREFVRRRRATSARRRTPLRNGTTTTTTTTSSPRLRTRQKRRRAGVVRAVIIETAPFRREQHVCVYVMIDGCGRKRPAFLTGVFHKEWNKRIQFPSSSSYDVEEQHATPNNNNNNNNTKRERERERDSTKWARAARNHRFRTLQRSSRRGGNRC